MKPRAGTIYYDASCGICSAGERNLGPLAARLGYARVSLQSEEAAEVLGLKPGEIPEEVKLRTADGRVLSGVDAFVHLSRHLWWGRPLSWMAALPGGRPVLGWIYRRIAAHRHGISRACGLKPMPEARGPGNG